VHSVPTAGTPNFDSAEVDGGYFEFIETLVQEAAEDKRNQSK